MDVVSEKTDAETGTSGTPATDQSSPRAVKEARFEANPSISDAGERGNGDVPVETPAEREAAEATLETQVPAVGAASGALADKESEQEQEALVAKAVPPSPIASYLSPKLTIAQLKEKIMATVPSNEEMKQATEKMTETMNDAVNEVQTRAKAAYDKSSETMGELGDFAKGNVEAVVESSKIIASGMQDLGRSYAEEAKVAYEQMTADLKELAAVKSPTELFQLQGKIMRRNFDTLVAASSKNTEAMMKLANDAFAPLSGRVNAAAEKMTKGS